MLPNFAFVYMIELPQSVNPLNVHQHVYLIAPRVNPDTMARWAKITRMMIGITMIIPTVLTRFQGKPHEAR